MKDQAKKVGGTAAPAAQPGLPAVVDGATWRRVEAGNSDDIGTATYGSSDR